MIVAVVIDDGRPSYLAQIIEALEQRVSPVDATILIDDTGSQEYANYLEWTYPQFSEQVHHAERRGLAGAVESAWRSSLDYGADFVWYQEDDQQVVSDVDLIAFSDLLTEQPHLAQIVLKRQAFNDEEIRAGGIVEASPDEYDEYGNGTVLWTENTHLFSFGPSLIPRTVIECALANTSVYLEREVTDALLPFGYKFCYWGAKYDPPTCHHIGYQRSDGYRW